jgi:integrase
MEPGCWEYVDWLQKTFLNRCGKTAKARRTVPLSERVLSILRNRRERRTEGRVFPTPKQRSQLGHFSLSGIEQQFAAARKEAGLPKELVRYCARHTYATDALARTAPAMLRR